MKRKITFLAISLILSLNTFSQIVFENGYFINDSNQTIECLIKNVDWRNNPTDFEYMLFQDTIVRRGSIATVRGFGINGVSNYIRANVKLDRSDNNVNFMSSEKNPDFHEELLFLKVLIDGKASFYQYVEGNLTRFFYNINDSEINQLVYRRYIQNSKIKENNYFKQQLIVDLSCQDTRLNDVENLEYTKKDLEKFIMKYNECHGYSYRNYGLKQKKDLFNLSFRPGINYSSLSISNATQQEITYDFNNELNFRFGIEAELLLPFNKNKWGIIIEPTYQYYKSETENEVDNVSGGFIVAEVSYQSIELPIGLRHNLFLNKNSKFFAEISYVFDFSFNSHITMTRIDGSIFNELDLKSRNNLGLGIGYKYKDKYSLGLRYETSRHILGEYFYWTSSYKTFSLCIGYSIF